MDGGVDPERQLPVRSKRTFIFKIVFLPMLWLLMLPYIIISICLTGKVNDRFVKLILCDFHSDEIDRVIERSHRKLENKGVVFATRLGCILLLLAVVLLCVSILHNLRLFGNYLWLWFFLAAYFSLAWVVVFIVLTLVLSLVYAFFKLQGRESDYYIEGLQESARWLIYFTSISIDWQVFVVAHSSTGRPSRQPLDIIHKSNYGTLTLLSLTIGASLWFLKCLLLLWWVGKNIYQQDKGKILAAGFHLYFLLHIFRQQNKNGQQCKREVMMPWVDKRQPPISTTTTARTIEQYMSSQNASSQQLLKVATRLKGDLQVLNITEDNDDTPHIPHTLTKELHQYICRSSSEAFKITVDFLTRQPIGLEEKDAQLLLEVMSDTNPEVINNSHEFEKWLVAAHRSCHQLRCKLIAYSELTNILNKVLRVLIVVVVIITWLFLTQLATTKLVLTLGTFLAGILLMVKEPFKYFADGLIFTFVSRTLKVGDRYLVEGKEMEVKWICILTTTFFVNRRMDYVTYTNQELATKSITKLTVVPGKEWQQDLEDCIELELDSSTSASQMLKLRDRIKELLKGYAEGKKIQDYSVFVKEVTRKVIIMSIHYFYILGDDHEKKDPRTIHMHKNEFRSGLLIKIKQHLEGPHDGDDDVEICQGFDA